MPEPRESVRPRRRLAPLLLRALLPILLTAFAAALGYAFAIFPMWRAIKMARIWQSLGDLPEDHRAAAMGAYFEDNHLNPRAMADFVWNVPGVMTPFVGFAPGPGPQFNAHINSHQFRALQEVTTPKPAGVTRVFLTGASVAFSMGAPSDERTIGGYLQSLLNEGAPSGKHYEVFTFAGAAWSSTHERIGIENRLSELEPDVVIELTGTADCLYGEHKQNVLWSRALTESYYWDLVNRTLKRSGFAPMPDVQDVSKKSVPPPTVAARLKKNVRLAATALSLVHARLLVFQQPAVYTTKKALSPWEQHILNDRPGIKADPEYYRACAGQIAEQLGMRDLPANGAFADLTGVFDQIPATQDVFLDAFHVGDRGNHAIAEGMLDSIRKAPKD